MLKFVVVSAIFLMPCTYPYGALSWNLYALSYQEAVWMCGTGNLQACDVTYAYDETARSGVINGNPIHSVPSRTWRVETGLRPGRPSVSLRESDGESAPTANRLAESFHTYSGSTALGNFEISSTHSARSAQDQVAPLEEFLRNTIESRPYT